MPKHIAVIMDGNGRWAQKRGLPRLEGHQAGGEAVIRLLKASKKFEVPYLTLFAFSTENWNRPASEVQGLMKLLERAIGRYADELDRHGRALRIIGCMENIPQSTRAALEGMAARTQHHTGGVVTVALSYSGRMDILQATKALANKAIEGLLDPSTLTEEIFADALMTRGLPDPDLLIRTSGEMRISNFLLWQLSYTEIFVTPKLWPDFAEEDFREAIEAYRSRHRRYGAL
ncbi:MAG: polyprenyl diphosphate synthase [Verrucomicrobiales bacterium]